MAKARKAKRCASAWKLGKGNFCYTTGKPNSKVHCGKKTLAAAKKAAGISATRRKSKKR